MPTLHQPQVDLVFGKSENFSQQKKNLAGAGEHLAARAHALLLSSSAHQPQVDLTFGKTKNF